MTRPLLTLAILALLFSAPLAANAQDANLPVIRANSTSVDVRDGRNFRKGHWGVDPNAVLDVYYAQRSTTPKKVTFITDVESISFDVEPGRDYDFVILLNGKTRCRTRISGLRRSGHPEGRAELSEPVEIPFALADDHMIRVEGRVNDSQSLTFQFDVGADTTVLYDSAFAKGAKPNFDGTMLNSGLGGTATRQTSNDNRLKVGGLVWDHEQVMHIGKQGRNVDGILGFNVFEDRVIRIDYDRKVLTVHPSPPAGLDSFTKAELQFRGTTPYVEATFEAGSATSKGWLVFDTGYTGSLLLRRDFWTASGLGAAAKVIGRSKSEGVGAGVVRSEIVRLPGLTLGGATLRGVPTHVEVESDGSRESAGLLGMEVLKRFDTVLDFQNNLVYLKPGRRVDAPFVDPASSQRTRIFVAGVAALLLFAGIYVFRRWRQRRTALAR